MVPSFKETVKPVRSKHSSLKWLEYNTLRLLGCQSQRYRFSNHFSNTSKSFHLMKRTKNFKRILEVNKFMKSAQKKNKKVHLNNRNVMYGWINYNCSHQTRISHNFIYYHENSKNRDFIHKLFYSLIMYLLVKSSSKAQVTESPHIASIVDASNDHQ